jgi:hypothetical protein
MAARVRLPARRVPPVASSGVTRRPPAVLAAFGAWTVFVWAVRLRNVLDDSAASTDGAGRVVDAAASVVFVAGGLALLAVVALGWHRRPARVDVVARFVRVAAAVTVAVWAVRGVGIATGDHGAAFVAVHLVLAAVSVALAAAAWWAQSHLRLRNTTTSTTVSTTISPSANG